MLAAVALTVPVTIVAAQSPAAGEGDPVAFTGQVLSSDPGEAVELYAVIWPNQTTLDALPIDARVPFVPAALEVYGNNYEVRIDPADVPASHVSANGVDIEVVATTADGNFAAYNETVSPQDGAWVRSDAALGEIAQLDDPLSDADEGEGPVTVQLPGGAGLPGTLVLDQAPTPGEVLDLTNDLTPDVLLMRQLEPICSTNKTTNTHDHRAKIGDVMPSNNNMTGRISYNIGTNHNIGVGYKSPDGSVSEGGTIERSSSESVAPVFRNEEHTAKTTWRYRDYKNSCTQKITARPESHQGGYYVPGRSRPSYTHCKRYAPMTWTTTDARAWTYQKGVTLFGGALNVNAQTGYSSKVEISYRFDVEKALCGSNANPPQARLVAGK